MFEKEISNYCELNKLAGQGGIVIFGGSEDKAIPLCELKQAFELDTDIYNRSLTGLTVKDAAKAYDACAASLTPDSVFLHLGASDLEMFDRNAAEFEKYYHILIAEARKSAPKCNIAIIALKNDDNSKLIAKMNQHLKFIADSERCEFCDISTKRLWNPKETKEVASFIYSMGFFRPLKIKRPVFDLVKILFCFEPSRMVQ